MKMPLQTYGEKPKAFTLDSNSEEMYMIGNEVGCYLRMMRGSIYKRYPQLWKRMATSEERKRMFKYAIHQLPAHVMIVKASEVEELLDGKDAKFKSESAALKEAQALALGIKPRTRGRQEQLTPNILPNNSHHLDAVPAGTPISRHRVEAKRVKTFPTWYGLHVHEFFCVSFKSVF